MTATWTLDRGAGGQGCRVGGFEWGSARHGRARAPAPARRCSCRDPRPHHAARRPRGRIGHGGETRQALRPLAGSRSRARDRPGGGGRRHGPVDRTHEDDHGGDRAGRPRLPGPLRRRLPWRARRPTCPPPRRHRRARRADRPAPVGRRLPQRPPRVGRQTRGRRGSERCPRPCSPASPPRSATDASPTETCSTTSTGSCWAATTNSNPSHSGSTSPRADGSAASVTSDDTSPRTWNAAQSPVSSRCPLRRLGPSPPGRSPSPGWSATPDASARPWSRSPPSRPTSERRSRISCCAPRSSAPPNSSVPCSLPPPPVAPRPSTPQANGSRSPSSTAPTFSSRRSSSPQATPRSPASATCSPSPSPGSCSWLPPGRRPAPASSTVETERVPRGPGHLREREEWWWPAPLGGGAGHRGGVTGRWSAHRSGGRARRSSHRDRRRRLAGLGAARRRSEAGRGSAGAALVVATHLGLLGSQVRGGGHPTVIWPCMPAW